MNIIFLGPQSSGKGTQAKLLSEKLNIPVITTGNILRKKKASGDEEGKMIASFIDEGKLVPDKLITKIVQEEVAKEKYKSGIILDGYPRNLEQAQSLEQFLKIDKVIFLDVPDAIVLKRMSARRICKECGATFNLDSKPPKEEGKCDKCGNELVQRHDDTETAIAMRLNIYHNQTEPLIKHYEDEGKLVRIDGTKNIEQVHQDIIEKLNF